MTINNFVEHSNAFIIVVSNEEEIGRWQLESNPELQMLVLLNKRFDVPVPLTDAEEISFYAMANGNEPQPSHAEMSINPAKMRTMREYVFNSNEQYKRIKEKVIGITIDYVPDLPEIYKKVIDESRIEKSLLDATANLIEFFLDIAQKENHPNIRSFQFFLEKTKSIFGIIGEQPIFVQDTIIKYCFRSCILHMKGVSQEAWESEFGMRCYGSPFIETDNIYGFKFIDDFIKTNVIIKEDVLSAIKHFVDYNDGLPGPPIQPLSGHDHGPLGLPVLRPGHRRLCGAQARPGAVPPLAPIRPVPAPVRAPLLETGGGARHALAL